MAFLGHFLILLSFSLLFKHSLSEEIGIGNKASINYRSLSLFEVEEISVNSTIEDQVLEEQIHALEEWINANMASDQKNRPIEDEQSTIKPQPPGGQSPVDFSIFKQFFELGQANQKKANVCGVMKVVIGYLFHRIRDTQSSEKDVVDTVLYICKVISGIRVTTYEVCEGIVERMGPTFYFIVKERPNLSAKTFVGIVLQQIGCSVHDPQYDWELRVGRQPRRKRPLIEEPKAPMKLVKILQIADMHVDPLYEPGGRAECANEILCCHPADGRPSKESQGAGYFGDNRKCDTPYSTLELTLKHVNETHPDIEYFYMTGDLVPHNLWYTSRADNSKILETCTQMILKYFPNTKVFPMLGNHEAHPVNFFSPSDVPKELRTDWIYQVAWDAWKQWIPADQEKTFLSSGFYSVRIPERRLRVIGLNSNLCYGFNFWQLYEVKDQGGLLANLQAQLADAEANGEFVHIVGHVPPGHPDCYRVWSREFYKIIAKYRNVVKGQWYGHTHYDEFKLYYSPEDKTVPMSALWIGGSLTPYRVNNMAYKLYYADDSNWDIIDHETWIFDLKKANENPDVEPTWFKLYSAKELYELPDVRPASLGLLITKMAKDKKIFDKFYQLYFKATSPHDIEDFEKCETYCQKVILCGIVQPYQLAEEECNNVQKMVDGIVLPGLEPAVPPISS